MFPHMATEEISHVATDGACFVTTEEASIVSTQEMFVPILDPLTCSFGNQQLGSIV